MYISESYIESILQESKITSLIRQGKISAGAIAQARKFANGPDPLYVKQLKNEIRAGKRKVEDLEHYIQKTGMFKSYAEWARGMEHGSNQIMKKVGAKETDDPGIFIQLIMRMKTGKYVGKVKDNMDAMTVPSLIRGKKYKIVLPNNKDLDARGQRERILVKRHEVDEARNMERVRNKKGSGLVGGMTGLPVSKNGKVVKDAKGNVTMKPGTRFFSHASPRVLKLEQEYMRFASAVYGGKASAANRLNDIRKWTGEYRETNSIGDINKWENKRIKDLKEEIKAIQYAAKVAGIVFGTGVITISAVAAAKIRKELAKRKNEQNHKS